jgi:transcriptional regulator with XRE-family HTH domain
MEKSAFTDEYAVLLDLLRESRKAAGITQVELAARLKKGQSYVSKVERGELRLDVIQLRTICRVLGMDLSTFAAALENRLSRK